MRSQWQRLNAWAYALGTRRLWTIWVALAAVAAVLLTALTSPWSWVATLPLVLLGYVLFSGQSRRERDEEQQT